MPPRSTRSRSSRVHSREPGRPRVRPRPSAPASMRCDFRPALRGVPVRAVLDVLFLVSVWRFRAGLTWCHRPEARRPPRPGPRPRPRGSRAGAAAGLLLVRGKGSMGPGPWPRHRVRWGARASTGRHGPLGAFAGLEGTGGLGSASAPRRSSIKVVGHPSGCGSSVPLARPPSRPGPCACARDPAQRPWLEQPALRHAVRPPPRAPGLHRSLWFYFCKITLKDDG